MQKILEIEFYQDEDKIPVVEWLDNLDYENQARINKRLARIEDNGNLGEYKNLGEGIYEFRFFFGSGYRIYFAKQGEKIILLLNGGDKNSQAKDIKKAKEYWKKYIGKNYN